MDVWVYDWETSTEHYQHGYMGVRLSALAILKKGTGQYYLHLPYLLQETEISYCRSFLMSSLPSPWKGWVVRHILDNTITVCVWTHIPLPHFLYIVHFFAASYVYSTWFLQLVHSQIYIVHMHLCIIYWNTVAVGLLGNTVCEIWKLMEWSFSSGCGYSY